MCQMRTHSTIDLPKALAARTSLAGDVEEAGRRAEGLAVVAATRASQLEDLTAELVVSTVLAIVL